MRLLETFYEPNGSANRFSNKERSRSRPNPQARVLLNREVDVSEPTSDRSYGMMDAANNIVQTPPLEPAFQRETIASSSAMGGNCFDDAQMSDSGNSYSDFTDDRLADAGRNSGNGLLAQLNHLPNANVSQSATHHDVHPAPNEFGSFRQCQLVTGSAPFAVGFHHTTSIP